MINLFNWVTTLVESFTFYGGGKGGGGSSSSSQPVDFFGKDARAPYANLLAQLLGVGGTGGGYGATQGYYTNGSGSSYSDPNGGHWESRSNGFGLSNQVWVPNSRGGRNRNTTPSTYVPGTPGMSLTDFVKAQPGFQFQYGQGLDALNRQFASTGVGQTGAQDVALQGYGNQYAANSMQQLISNLMGPAGVSMIGNTSTSQSTGASPIPGMIGTIGAAIISDRNLKTNIKHINTINGIKIYSFNYIWSYIKSIGVMAQDLLEMPEYKHAVHTTNTGYVVDYSKLPI
jgi:hypothetical protein